MEVFASQECPENQLRLEKCVEEVSQFYVKNLKTLKILNLKI